MLKLSVPLAPKDPDGPLRVLIIGRISTVHQNTENIEASYRYVEAFLKESYQGPLEVKLLGEQASGMLTTRATIQEAERLIESGNVDLVLSEDLGRIYRNPRHQYDFVQNAVDMHTRVICLGDNLDTSDENWEVIMGAATLRHGLFIPDTRRRVRRTATHSFHKGGLVQKVRYGYRKLSKEEAASGKFGPPDLRIAKLPECTPVIKQMKDQVLDGMPYAKIAKRLENQGIKPGPYVKTGRWTDRVLKDLLRDPILSGTRTFRDMIYEPVFRTGHHRRRKNLEPEAKHWPELAHLTQNEQEELWQAMDARAARYGDASQRQSIRRNKPRRQSIWPGQATTCGICGGLMYYAGKHLKCENSLANAANPCWNHVQVPAELTRQRIVEWFISYCDQDQVTRQRFQAAVHELQRESDCEGEALRAATDREIQSLESQIQNLTKAIATGGQLEVLLKELVSTETDLQLAREKQLQLTSTSNGTEDGSTKLSLEESLRTLINESYEFADLLRRVLPKFVIWPVQALDTAQVRPRARFIFQPSAIGDESQCQSNGKQPPPEVAGVIDLFDPPVHIKSLEACVDARNSYPNLTLRQIAAKLGINYMTVKRALDFSQKMQREGVEEPYRQMYEQPEQASRWGPRN